VAKQILGHVALVGSAMHGCRHDGQSTCAMHAVLSIATPERSK
jgi:hypothetical protein